MRYVLVLTMAAAVTACAPQMRSGEWANRVCVGLGHQAGSNGQRQCHDRLHELMAAERVKATGSGPQLGARVGRLPQAESLVE